MAELRHLFSCAVRSVAERPGPGGEVERLEERLENYPVLNDEHFSSLEAEEANQIWRDCYSVKERVDYVRRYRSQFEFSDFADMLGCIRGHYFSGYASELFS